MGRSVVGRRPWWIATLLLAAVVVVTTWDATMQAGLPAERSHLARTEHELVRTRTALAAATHRRRVDADQERGLRSAVGATASAAAAATQQLGSSTASVEQQLFSLSSVQACLVGVGSSYQALSAAAQPAAIHRLTGSSCTQPGGSGGPGPAYPYDFPDPSVLRVGATYVAYATNSSAGNIEIITSTDLVHWLPVGDALPHLPAWAGMGDTWAPSVVELGGVFVMYYTVEYAFSGRECISVATATGPEGPFIDNSGGPLVCQLSLGGSIDPSAFVDPSGGVYLDWRSLGAGGQPPTIWAQQLSASGTALLGDGPSALLEPSQSWEGGIVEAPDMFWLDGQRYLLYAGSEWQTKRYAVGLAECPGPLSPCTKPLDHPLLATGPGIAGPGGATEFRSANGTSEIAFAAWLPGEVGYPHSRLLFIRRLAVDGGVPRIGA